MNDAARVPPIAANVGARSVLPASRPTCTPARTPGPRTISGTWMSVSYAVCLPGGHPVLPEVEAVVGREHDVGVVELLGGAQRVDELDDAAVDGLQGTDPLAVEVVDRDRLLRAELREVAHEARRPAHVGLVEARGVRRSRPGKLLAVLTRRRGRLVRCVHREVGEERPVFVRGVADELVGQPDVHVGAVVARPVVVLVVALVLVEHVAVLVVRVARRPRSPSCPSPAARSWVARRWDTR